MVRFSLFFFWTCKERMKMSYRYQTEKTDLLSKIWFLKARPHSWHHQSVWALRICLVILWVAEPSPPLSEETAGTHIWKKQHYVHDQKYQWLFLISSLSLRSRQKHHADHHLTFITVSNMGMRTNLMKPIWAVGLVTFSLSMKGATGKPSDFSLSLCIWTRKDKEKRWSTSFLNN